MNIDDLVQSCQEDAVVVARRRVGRTFLRQSQYACCEELTCLSWGSGQWLTRRVTARFLGQRAARGMSPDAKRGFRDKMKLNK